MQCSYTLTLAILVFIVSGCSNTKQLSLQRDESVPEHANSNQRDLQTPMNVELAKPGSSLETVTIRSGQIIVLDKTYCPPIQLRDANGVVVRKLRGGTRPQKLLASPGMYTIVGHSPTAGEWTRKIEVTE